MSAASSNQLAVSGWTAARGRIADYLALAKVRMNLLVGFSTFAGAFLAARGPLDAAVVVHVMFGTVLASIAASALNQYLERDVDAKMERTRDRPLPQGRLQPNDALLLGTVCAVGGVAYLAAFTNVLTAFLAAVTVATYVFAYTPLKQKSTLSTLVGAVPGALPAMGGWTAVRGAIDFEAWILFAIVFFWQIPHFMAIAWRHREDYARGGVCVLPVVDETGRVTGQQVLFHTFALIPITLLPSVVGLTGPVYFAAAGVLGLAFLCTGAAFVVNKNAWAPRLFRGSIAYLAVLFAVMMLDKGGAL